MSKYIILPDVTCDLSKDLRDYFGLEDYFMGYVQINGNSIKTRLDWENISKDEFYKTLSNKKNQVSSAACTPEEYYQTFKKYVNMGYKVLSMSISSKISGTFSIASVAANRVKEEINDAEIYCFDSTRMSGSFGLLVCYALEKQKEGKTFEELINYLEETKLKVHQMGPIDDLTFVARRGQISKGKAIMGNFVGIKPMGDSNTDGYVTVLSKVKGIRKALDATVEYIKEIANDMENQYLIITHSDRENYALELKEKIEKECKFKKVFVSDVFSGCGTNIGPGMICAYFLGNQVTDDLQYEKEILAKSIEKIS